MVATTFSADTPNLVTELVRTGGVAKNWAWWAFLITGMFTVFIYAKFWRRSNVLTDLEFYEMRYGGKSAAFLRGFRAVYLGLFLNVMIMAIVCVAATKLGSILLGWSAGTTLLITCSITVLYSGLGGLRGVIITDFFQFIIAMVGSVWAAIVILDLPQVGGLEGLISHSAVIPALDMIPNVMDGNDINETFIALLIIPLAVQWWSSWYPGAEPGGGSYVAQRMLAAKNENHAVKATLFFNIAHYAIRPWPWIIIALASMIVFPTVADISLAFPDARAQMGEDIAYPAMLTLLPKGLLGLVLASLIAAFMSTISTHLNWGASYMVNDIHGRFINPGASEKEKVWVGRIATFVLMGLAVLMSFAIDSAKEGFNLLLQIGAGTGLIYLLRWFWWRVNVWSEISGMLIASVVAIALALMTKDWGNGNIILDLSDGTKLVTGTLITTIGWIVITLLTKPTDKDVLQNFYDKIQPYGKGWRNVVSQESFEKKKSSSLTIDVVCVFVACIMVYSFLLGTGKLIYGQLSFGLALIGLGVVSAFVMWKLYFARNDSDQKV